jgi:hypothetical protein
LIRIADRLAQLEAGSAEADRTIHDATGQVGPVLLYTRDGAAARGLLPEGFEWLASIYAGVTVYAACRRIGLRGGVPHPHHGQWGRTLPLAMCGAVVRAYAGLAKR